MRTDRPTAAIALLSAVALFLAGCSGGGFEGTTRCNGTVAEVVYDPNTIVASASITQASVGGSLQYSREHCTLL